MEKSTNINVYFHSDSEFVKALDYKLDQILKHVLSNNLILKKMGKELDDLTAKVESNGTVIGSAIVLLQGLKAALDAAGTDPAKLKALSDTLGSKDQELSDAIVANTPAEG